MSKNGSPAYEGSTPSAGAAGERPLETRDIVTYKENQEVRSKKKKSHFYPLKDKLEATNHNPNPRMQPHKFIN